MPKENLKASDFESFHFVFKVTLNKLAPLKRSKLTNKFNKETGIENWSKYKRQRNRCSNLLKKYKNGHFDNLNVKEVT